VLMLPLCSGHDRAFVGDILHMTARIGTEGSAPETCDRRLLTTQNIWKINRPCSVVAGREPFASSNAYAGLTPKPYSQ
jgi:hypothetical protein